MVVENVAGDCHQSRVSHPRAIVTVSGLALLVLTHLVDRDLVGRRVVLDGNLGRHATDGQCPASMTGLDDQL